MRLVIRPEKLTLLAGTALLAACAAITGASELSVSDAVPTKDAGEDAKLPDDDGGGARTCGDQRVCLATPSGWSPIVLVSGAAVNALCPTSYATKSAVKGLTGTTKCACRCGGASGAGACDGDLFLGYGNAQCTGASASVTPLVDAGCTTVTLGPLAQNAKAKLNGALSCSPQITQDIPQPVDLALCTGGDVTSSPVCRTGESCVPAISRGSRLCIAHDGEVECPSGGYTRWTTGTNPTDDRACTGCTCTPDPAGCAKGVLSFFANDTCTTLIGSMTTDDTCKTSPVTAQPAAVTYKPGAGCNLTQEPAATGALVFQGARTVCCL